jgi:hypothetical protein
MNDIFFRNGGFGDYGAQRSGEFDALAPLG